MAEEKAALKFSSFLLALPSRSIDAGVAHNTRSWIRLSNSLKSLLFSITRFERSRSSLSYKHVRTASGRRLTVDFTEYLVTAKCGGGGGGAGDPALADETEETMSYKYYRHA